MPPIRRRTGCSFLILEGLQVCLDFRSRRCGMINRAFSLLERLRGILNKNIGPYFVHSRVKGALTLLQNLIEESEVALSLRNLHPTLVFIRMRFVNDDKVHPVLDALLHHDESTDSPVAVLERMQVLEPCVKTGDRLEVLLAALPFGEQCRYWRSECRSEGQPAPSCS